MAARTLTYSLNIMESPLEAIHARYAPVDARVADILEHIRRDCRELALERRNEGNERQVEEFIARLRVEFGERVVIERQRLSGWAVRTTRWNYLFTVPGESDDRIVLVAHYDTWRGPGADDNTTGEEILKQYLIADLRRAAAGTDPHVLLGRLRRVRPDRTHVAAPAGARPPGRESGAHPAELALRRRSLGPRTARRLPLRRLGLPRIREDTLSGAAAPHPWRGLSGLGRRRPALHPPGHARGRLPACAHSVRGLRLDQRSPGGRRPSARHQVQQLSRRRHDRPRLVPGSEQRAVGPAAGGVPSPRRPDGSPAVHRTASHSGDGAGRDGPGQGVPHRVRRQDPHAARYAGPGVRRAVTRDALDPRLLLPPARRRLAGG